MPKRKLDIDTYNEKRDYSKTKENPAGINIDDPSQRPAASQEIRIGQGVATIVQ